MNGARQGGLACLCFSFLIAILFISILRQGLFCLQGVLLGLTETFFSSNCEVSSLSQLVPG